MNSHNIPIISVFCYYDGIHVWKDGHKISASDLSAIDMNCDEYFIKEVDSWCGVGARKIKAPIAWNTILNGKRFIIQPVVKNDESLRKLNPSTLNTIRIATCMKNASVELWDPGMLRVGRSGADVDNFFQGGIGVAIENDGSLCEYGFCHDKTRVYEKLTRHPDSGVIFAGYKIPFYQETVKLVKQAHLLFPTIPTIGWDVAITDKGPQILEGNHDWDIEMLQIVRHEGQMRIRDRIYPPIINSRHKEK